MWNDEDNNPYGTSFDRRDSQTSSSINPTSPSSRNYRSYDVPHTPTSGSEDDDEPAFGQVSATAHDDNRQIVETHEETSQRRKPGGYTSRIEQILYENPDTPIIITDAGKSVESGGRYIVYTIRTGDLEVRRRYSEFASLREALTRLHPTLIIPPIPEKHTMADYAAKPTSAKQDQQIIDLRKRMLAVFLNRCRRMEAVRDDGVWWRFLDPNASWSEVLHSHPIASIPKSILKAPPLDTANPSLAHNFLPVPSTSAKLKTSAGHSYDIHPPPTQTRSHVIGRFPPDSNVYSEHDLDPYFVSYEASAKELEQLLNGPMERVNRRTLSHLSALATDLCELGSRFNAFALSEQAPSLGPAIERVGQAADLSYIATEELAGSLGASFAEPMRENAQFAGVVKSVLRYRVLKRVQQDLTTEELAKKRDLLEQLEQSEAEARRIEQYLSTSQQLSPPPKRSTSLRESSSQHRRDAGQDDTESIDSDFPPNHGDNSSSTPSVNQGLPDRSASISHKKAPSSNSITNKIFGPLRHAIQGVADVDPERTRRDTIGKTRESIGQLEQAQVASEQDVKDASASVLRDLKRFQKDKEDDLKRYMLAYAKSQVEWAKKSKQQWEEARAEVDKIDEN
ncbi:Sorting nexin, cytoplasm-to-vacuole targeting pathway/endosomal sorting [Claviceps digitariae]|nr:Sorting nexin, cytoplasm-to-vacuole targeting pathway/endosomal sorting [Claviceps digitariae]